MIESRTPEHHIVINVGETFTEVYTFTDTNGDPVDATGYTGTMQVRAEPFATSALIAAPSVSAGNSSGQFTVTLASGVSAALTPGVYLYQLDITNGSETLRMLEGKCWVKDTVIH